MALYKYFIIIIIIKNYYCKMNSDHLFDRFVFNRVCERVTMYMRLIFFADLENLDEDMIDAFRPVLMLLPSQPSNPQYGEFLDQSRDYSYKPPFNAPKPPYPEMKLQV